MSLLLVMVCCGVDVDVTVCQGQSSGSAMGAGEGLHCACGWEELLALHNNRCEARAHGLTVVHAISLYFVLLCLHGPGRQLSDAQESAQLLTGLHLPEAILNGFLKKLDGSLVTSTARVVRCIHLSPYDSCFEKAALQFHLADPTVLPRISVTSASTDVEAVAYVEQCIGMYVLQAGRTSLH